MVGLCISAITGQVKVLLLVISLLTQDLIQNSQKPVHIYSLVSVDFSIFLSLILALLRGTWPSKVFGGLHRSVL